jgi:antitoxin (DNA-binding transcriptional repressor) of toxin-antitoxin stability system
MTRIALADAQQHLRELIETTAPGEEIEIVRDDQVVARLVTVASPSKRFPAKAGSARGMILYMADDFDAPLDDFKEYME